MRRPFNLWLITEFPLVCFNHHINNVIVQLLANRLKFLTSMMGKRFSLFVYGNSHLDKQWLTKDPAAPETCLEFNYSDIFNPPKCKKTPKNFRLASRWPIWTLCKKYGTRVKLTLALLEMLKGSPVSQGFILCAPWHISMTNYEIISPRQKW